MAQELKYLDDELTELSLAHTQEDVQLSSTQRPEPSPADSTPRDGISPPGSIVQLALCRSCAEHFSYSLPGGGVVTIMVGIPAETSQYKAISHVWGPYSIVEMLCKNCSATHSIRLRGASTFYHVMQLAGPGASIWIDNMSINQNDPSDKAKQLAVMGEIYGKAQCVSVLLPETDKAAYNTVAKILDLADTLLARKAHILYNFEDNVADRNILQEIKATGELAKEFFHDIIEFQDDLDKYTYWKRAWTFQEWALAFDVEISVDTGRRETLDVPILRQVKSKIVYAAIMIADYKLRRADMAMMDVGFSRPFARGLLQKVKRLFPFEDAFATFNEISEFEVRFQTAFPNEGTDAILGLRPKGAIPRTPEQKSLSRFIHMVDSFAGMSKREATFEADLVCSWASMCNIQYEYSMEDSFEEALAKAIRALRKSGVTIFNFVVTNEDIQDIDFKFLDYVTTQAQQNAASRGLFPGIPVLTGHADTAAHFTSALFAIQRSFAVRPRSVRLHAQRISGARIKMAVPLSEPLLVVGALQLACSGTADNFMFKDVMQHIMHILGRFPDSFLRTRILVIAAIPLVGESSSSEHFNAWSICDSATFISQPIPFVAREKLNSTLVLAQYTDQVSLYTDQTSDMVTVMSYLTISDQQCGTFLIPVSEDGQIHIEFKTPQSSGMMNSDLMIDRELRALVQFVGSRPEYMRNTTGANYVVNGPNDLSLLSNIFGNGFLQDNDSVIKSLGDHQVIMGQMLREIIARRERRFDRDGRSALTIDIGHPELATKEQEVAAGEELAQLKRRSSI